MTRIEKTLSTLKANNKTALVPYITAGDPHPNMTVDLMHTLVANGADMIELGVPFSDPMADGPVIQKAVERALKHNTSMTNVLDMVRVFRKTDTETPVILMGYLNPVEVLGYANFANNAFAAGVDGVLTVDMPPEESAGYFEAIQAAGLDRIFLASPTTPDARLQGVNQKGSGFVYYVSLKGVTGSKALDVEDVRAHVARLREKVSISIGIGFGIRDGETAYQMAKVGDAIIVGSALVNLIEARQDQEFTSISAVIADKMQEFRTGIDRADKGE